MAFNQDAQASISATATGTNAGATATVSGVAGVRYFVTHVSGVSDAATALQILDGSTVKWQINVQANVAFTVALPDPIVCTYGNSCAGKIVASTVSCAVNVAGFSQGN